MSSCRVLNIVMKITESINVSPSNYIKREENKGFFPIKRSRENIMSGAGRKVRFYATNEELPRQIFNEVSVHSTTQDCSSNKIQIPKQNVFRSLTWRKQHLHQCLLSSDQRISSSPMEPPWRHSEPAPTHPNTVVCSD